MWLNMTMPFPTVESMSLGLHRVLLVILIQSSGLPAEFKFMFFSWFLFQLWCVYLQNFNVIFRTCTKNHLVRLGNLYFFLLCTFHADKGTV